MEEYQACRICLVKEKDTKLHSMFSQNGEDEKNYNELSSCKVRFLVRLCWYLYVPHEINLLS